MKRVIGVFCLFFPLTLFANENPIPLDKVILNPSDKASLQRGAKLYVNYCQGCHSLEYMRYKDMAEGIGMVDAKGRVLEKIVKNNLVLTGDLMTDSIRTALPKADAMKWFGIVPPDLTLSARVRGADWLYTYLRHFYYDPNQVWGTNNALFPKVAMPNVLLSLRGVRVPIYRDEIVWVEGKQKKISVIDHFITLKRGTMTPLEFDDAMADLVNFLVYVSEPHRAERYRLGIAVLLFLLVLLILTYLLKKEYWKKIR